MSTVRNNRVIRICKYPKGIAPNGKRSFWYIFPTTQARNKMFCKLLDRFPELNYSIYWNDKHGYGMQLTDADWVRTEGRNHYHIN